MALLTEATIMEAARRAETMAKKASPLILRDAAATKGTSFDVFLSHSYHDAERVTGIRQFLIECGLSVYVDWIVDGALDRTQVTAATANILRLRMKQCAALFYAHSVNATASKWMPWEVGYFDALKQRVAILPIARTTSEKFHGSEFLGLYPWVDSVLNNQGRRMAFVNSAKGFTTVTKWIAGGQMTPSP